MTTLVESYTNRLRDMNRSVGSPRQAARENISTIVEQNAGRSSALRLVTSWSSATTADRPPQRRRRDRDSADEARARAIGAVVAG